LTAYTAVQPANRSLGPFVAGQKPLPSFPERGSRGFSDGSGAITVIKFRPIVAQQIMPETYLDYPFQKPARFDKIRLFTLRRSCLHLGPGDECVVYEIGFTAKTFTLAAYSFRSYCLIKSASPACTSEVSGFTGVRQPLASTAGDLSQQATAGTGLDSANLDEQRPLSMASTLISTIETAANQENCCSTLQAPGMLRKITGDVSRRKSVWKIPV
jgi:hypothetical protein